MTPAQLLAVLAPLAGDADYVHVSIGPDSVDVQFGGGNVVEWVDAACALLNITPEWSPHSQFPWWYYSATTTYHARTLTVLTVCTGAEHAAHTGQQAVTS